MSTENPLLSKLRIPGETFQMPSQGLFYSNNELSPEVKNGEVHIYPMTAIDEIIIRSPDKVFTGEAVNEVFSHCIPQILKPDQLLTQDVDFLMVCLRKLSYGDQFDVSYKHICEGSKKHTYPISMNSFIKKVKKIDPTKLISDFTLTMENGQIIKFEPLRYKDFIAIMQKNANDDADTDALLNYILSSLVNVIKSVDDIEDKQMIYEWLSKIPTTWGKQISKRLESVTSWGIDFIINTQCMDCKADISLPVPGNPISFFI